MFNMQKRNFILLLSLSLVIAAMFFVSAACTGTPAVNCASYGTFECEPDAPSVCGDTNCREEEYYDDTITVCDCSLVSDCESLSSSQCGDVSGCSWSGAGGPVCGDGNCDSDETFVGCPSDCGVGDVDPIWIGLDGGILKSFDGIGTDTSHFDTGTAINAILLDSLNGEIWTGHDNGKLRKYNLETGSLQVVTDYNVDGDGGAEDIFDLIEFDNKLYVTSADTGVEGRNLLTGAALTSDDYPGGNYYARGLAIYNNELWYGKHDIDPGTPAPWNGHEDDAYLYSYGLLTDVAVEEDHIYSSGHNKRVSEVLIYNGKVWAGTDAAGSYGKIFMYDPLTNEMEYELDTGTPIISSVVHGNKLLFGESDGTIHSCSPDLVPVACSELSKVGDSLNSGINAMGSYGSELWIGKNNGQLLSCTFSGENINCASRLYPSGSTAITSLMIYGSLCGNGEIVSGEECDDGNSFMGDGCSLTCQVEPGYVCSGSPSVCAGMKILDVNFESITGSVVPELVADYTFSKTASVNCGVPGILGVACEFDNDPEKEIVMGDSIGFNNAYGNSLREMTVSAWVKPTSLPGGVGRHVLTSWYEIGGGSNPARRGFVFGDGYGSADHFGLYVKGGESELGSSVYDNGFFAEHLNDWVYVTATFEGSVAMKLYVNGVLANTNSGNIISEIVMDPNTPFTIGHSADNDATGMWDGLIDEVKVWNFVKTDAEILAMYNTYNLGGVDGACSDSDGGLNLFSAGTAGGSADSCSGNIITEYYCDAGVMQTYTGECPGGASCEDGACAFAGGSGSATCDGTEYPIRTRVDGQYCSALTLTMESQLSTGDSCNEDYECQTNACLDQKCTSLEEEFELQRGLLQRMYCRIVSFFTGESYNECLLSSAGEGDFDVNEDDLVLDTCSDSDGGLTYGVTGNCNHGAGTLVDSCDGNILLEYHCASETCTPVFFDCAENDGTCVAGRCVVGAA
jgi:cysteine-rich repeat protein